MQTNTKRHFKYTFKSIICIFKKIKDRKVAVEPQWLDLNALNCKIQRHLTLIDHFSTILFQIKAIFSLTSLTNSLPCHSLSSSNPAASMPIHYLPQPTLSDLRAHHWSPALALCSLFIRDWDAFCSFPQHHHPRPPSPQFSSWSWLFFWARQAWRRWAAGESTPCSPPRRLHPSPRKPSSASPASSLT